VQCSGEQPQNCGAGGAWQDNGALCVAPQTCVGGACASVDCTTYTAPKCNGNATCDLRTNTCCVTEAFVPTGRCVPDGDSGGTCNSNESPFHCEYACDCTGGQSCCGTINTSTFAGAASCQAVANGGTCTPGANEAAAQLCEQDAECKNGQPCIAQTCNFGAMFRFCGIQTQQPFACTAN
jgi:hypothetical protein